MFGTMRKRKRGKPLAKRTHNGLMRDTAERNDRAKLREGRNGRREKRAAAANFSWRRLVLWRHAAHRIGNRARDKPQTIVAARLIIACGEAEIDQRCIEKIASEIAGKGPPGPIGAAQARRETDHEQTCIEISEIRNRRVMPIRLRHPDGIAEGREARAKRTVRIGLLTSRP